MKNQYIAACLAGATALCLESSANANIIINDPRVTGNQWGYALGMDFTVNSTVSVSALGTFDSNISGLSDPVSSAQIAASFAQAISSGDFPQIQVGIFDVNTGVEVSPTALFDYADALAGSYYAVAGSIFKNITPFDLGPGTYSIVAVGYTYLLYSGNTTVVNPPVASPSFDTLNGALTLLPNGARASVYGNYSILDLPTFFTGGAELNGNPDFLAGTFIATHGVPDAGSTYSLLGIALLGIGSLHRKLRH